MRTIVLGVGNPILSDDGVGIHVAKELKQHIQDPNVTIDEAFTGGMNLLDLIVGFDKAILIDAVKMENAQAGDVKRFSIADFLMAHSCNPHDVSLTEALEIAKKLGETRIPHEIIIVGIIMDEMSCEFGEELSEAVAMAVPKAVEIVLSELKKNFKTSSWDKTKHGDRFKVKEI